MTHADDGSRPATHGDLLEMRTSLTSEFKSDMQELRTELKGEMQDLGATLRGEMQGIHSELKEAILRLGMFQTKMQAGMADMKREMATKDDVRGIMSAIDAFARQAQQWDRKGWVHKDRLDQHEDLLKDHSRRLGALEARRRRQ